MKTQKLLVIVASVCLMVSFNVSSFAQTACVEPDLADSMAEVLAQRLTAQGYEVRLDGNSVKIATDRGELGLDLSATCEELEDSGIQAHLVPQAETSAEDPADNTDDLYQLKTCLDSVDFLYAMHDKLCVLDKNDFICATEALLERIINSLKCFAAYAPPQPLAGPVVSVFVTKKGYQGNLGGLADADAICQAAAEAAGLSGTDWKAWLSTSDGEEAEPPGINAIDRIPDGQYWLVDGTTLIAADKEDLTDGRLKSAIDLNEDGRQWGGFVWTGTQADGNGTGSNCDNWTDNSSEVSGDNGFINTTDEAWTKYYDPVQCSWQRHLYCFGGVE